MRRRLRGGWKGGATTLSRNGFDGSGGVGGGGGAHDGT